MYVVGGLEFTPLEFETKIFVKKRRGYAVLEFTPLEFETRINYQKCNTYTTLEFTPLEFETSKRAVGLPMKIGIRIYSVGV